MAFFLLVAEPGMKKVVLCLVVSFAAVFGSAGCVTQQPATDVSNSVTGPTPVSNVPAATIPTVPVPVPTPTPTPMPTPASPSVAYVQDLQSIFQADCVRCHSGSRPDGGYSMSTYAQVMRAVSAGNARSPLVVVTQRNASMYRYWSGDAAAKAALVRSWVVDHAAAQTR